jgi:hypothetical protein
MAKKFWTIDLPDRTATVTLDYSQWNSRHRLWVDDTLICDKRVLLEFGAECEFEVEGHWCVLHIDVPGRLAFDYSLTVDGREIEPHSDPMDTHGFLFARKSAAGSDAAYPPAM